MGTGIVYKLEDRNIRPSTIPVNKSILRKDDIRVHCKLINSWRKLHLFVHNSSLCTGLQNVIWRKWENTSYMLPNASVACSCRSILHERAYANCHSKWEQAMSIDKYDVKYCNGELTYDKIVITISLNSLYDEWGRAQYVQQQAH